MEYATRLLNAGKAALARYATGLIQVRAPADPVSGMIFARQLDATTRSWRALVPLALVFVSGAILAFGRAAQMPLMVVGAALIGGAYTWALGAIPARTPEDRLTYVAKRQVLLAFFLGAGWALLGMAVTSGATRDVIFLVQIIQMALMAVGLIMYVNLPAGYLAFSTPIVMSLSMTLAPAVLGGPIVGLSLILVYYVILAKAAVDQSSVFAEAQGAVVRLAQSESARRQMARETAQAQARQDAEARAREAEQRDAATRQAEQIKRASLLELGERFEKDVAAAVTLLSQAVGELDRSAAQLAAIGQKSAIAAADVAERATAASSSALFAATAAEELGRSVSEIAGHVDGHAALSKAARLLASTSAQDIHVISDDTAKIDGVIELVDGVASQTKLLALNATIEAARAGEVGRGFAVVASEIKALANRTSSATSNVREQTGSIVGQIEAASGRMAQTAEKIDAVAGIASFIASSVTQQRQAAIEIGRETNLVASHVDDVRDRAAELASGASTTGRLARAMNETVAGITRQADALRAETAGFLNEIRAA